jgi:hypothetical protein
MDFLTRVFHTDRDELATKTDGVPRRSGDRRGDCPGFKGAALKGRAGASESTQASILM